MHFEKENSFKWLFSKNTTEIKEISRILLASQLWNVENDLVSKLIKAKSKGNWNNSIRDTSRSVSALTSVGIKHNDVAQWILSKQENNAWNDDVYDTTYALMALADMGVHNSKACKWLVDNYSSDWEYPGTTALIISALIKQNQIKENDDTHYSDYNKFINEHTRWILTQRDKNGAWKTIATSNICIQALMLAGYKEELNSDIEWVLDKMNSSGTWGKDDGNITSTALSLITLAQFIK